MKQISVIVPVYNLIKRLRECLDSLARQTFRDFEVIIVDDGSTDGSADLAREILTGHGLDFTVLVQERNSGPSAARNRGIRASKSKYVICVDGDDWVEPNFLEALYNAAEEKGADYASCGYRQIDTESGAAEPHPLEVPKTWDADRILEGFLRGRSVDLGHWATLFRREFLLNHGLFYDEQCFAGEDTEFLVKMLAHRPRGTFLPLCLYVYVQHQSMSMRKTRSREDRIRRYANHTGAHFREAQYILQHCSGSQRLCSLAKSFLLPQACQRQLSACAMEDDARAFWELLRSREVRRCLLDSWRSFAIKPEIFLKSCLLLAFPRLYYRQYQRRFR